MPGSVHLQPDGILMENSAYLSEQHFNNSEIWADRGMDLRNMGLPAVPEKNHSGIYRSVWPGSQASVSGAETEGTEPSGPSHVRVGDGIGT